MCYAILLIETLVSDTLMLHLCGTSSSDNVYANSHSHSYCLPPSRIYKILLRIFEYANFGDLYMLFLHVANDCSPGSFYFRFVRLFSSYPRCVPYTVN